jgi:hypothetical protein
MGLSVSSCVLGESDGSAPRIHQPLLAAQKTLSGMVARDYIFTLLLPQFEDPVSEHVSGEFYRGLGHP